MGQVNLKETSQFLLKKEKVNLFTIVLFTVYRNITKLKCGLVYAKFVSATLTSLLTRCFQFSVDAEVESSQQRWRGARSNGDIK